MLGFVAEWRVMHTSIPEVPLGLIAEALQRDLNKMEEGPEGLKIEKLVDRWDE